MASTLMGHASGPARVKLWGEVGEIWYRHRSAIARLARLIVMVLCAQFPVEIFALQRKLHGKGFENAKRIKIDGPLHGEPFELIDNGASETSNTVSVAVEVIWWYYEN